MGTRWGIAGVVVAVLALGSPPARADWPLYGQDATNSRDGGGGGPAPDAAPALQRAWTFTASDGDFTGTPVVSGGLVVAGSRGGTVYALDETTGALRWAHDFNQPINASMAISAGRVLVPLATVSAPSLAALSISDGAQLWSTTLDTQPDSETFSSPIVSGATAYIGTSGGTGETTNAAAHVRGSVVAVDVASGATRWKTYTVPAGYDGGAVWSSPSIDAATNTLYVDTGNAYHSPVAATTDALLALDASSGAIMRHFQVTAGDINQSQNLINGPDFDFGASPNLFAGIAGAKLVGAGQKSGVYWAFDRATLLPAWAALVGLPGQSGGVIGSTAWDGSALYGPDTVGGEVWSISPLLGTPRWLAFDSDAMHVNPVSVANGVVYSSNSDGFLVARDARTGATLARLPLGAPALGGVAIADGAVFAETGSFTPTGYVVALRPGSARCATPAPAADPVSKLVLGLTGLVTTVVKRAQTVLGTGTSGCP
jgi:polyvinyl alcohol dehydrogenase (cytochrome)